MTREALKDAFMAGWNMAQTAYVPDADPQALFATWYSSAIATGRRVTNFGVQSDLAAVDLAEVERRIIANTELLAEGMSDALQRKVTPDIAGVRTGRFSSTSPNESAPPKSPGESVMEAAREKDRQINQALGYPGYQPGEANAPKHPLGWDRAGKTKPNKVKGRKR